MTPRLILDHFRLTPTPPHDPQTNPISLPGNTHNTHMTPRLVLDHFRLAPTPHMTPRLIPYHFRVTPTPPT